MRKIRAVVFGLVSLGAFTPLALAKPNCATQWARCNEVADKVGAVSGEKEAQKARARCEDLVAICENTGKWGDLRGKFEPGVGVKNPEGSKTGAGGSKPKPGAHRTVDGSIVMVTPEGKEWLWNGKYNTVIDVRKDLTTGTLTQSHSVMQGDPDAPVVKLDGKYIRVSDPGYQAAFDAEQAKNKDKPIVRDHRTPKPSTPPVPGASAGGATSTHGAAAGQAPSSANAGSAATNTGGPIVRHHDGGANSGGTSAAIVNGLNGGANKKPTKYAQ